MMVKVVLICNVKYNAHTIIVKIHTSDKINNYPAGI